jgi:hypothetical protein
LVKSDSVSLTIFFIIYSLVINILLSYIGRNRSKFFPKIFLEIFYEYFIEGIEPPFHPSKCHIWGGYGRGEGANNTITPHANSEGREWFVNNFN